MIIYAFILALIDVIVLSQIDMWGVSIMAFLPVLYVYRNEARADELVAAGAVYGAVHGVFTEAAHGLATLAAYVVATALSVGLLRTVGSSRYRISLRGYDMTLMLASFIIVYWAIHASVTLGAVSSGQVAQFILWTLVVNMCLVLLVAAIEKKIGVQYGAQKAR